MDDERADDARVHDRLIARLRAAGCVFAEDEAAVLRSAAAAGTDLEAMVARRVAGEPLEVVVGFADFCGVRVRVDAGVFVPRARTTLMVRTAVEHLDGRATSPPVVVDLCCGTGAVGLAIARQAVGEVELVASDVDAAAVACARRNIEPVGGLVVQGDLDGGLPRRLRGRVDVLTCNAPYVPTEAIALMPPEAREHEPRVALDGGDDGLVVVRRALAAAPAWLTSGGMVLVEVGAAQLDDAVRAGRSAGLAVAVASEDDLGAGVVTGVRTA